MSAANGGATNWPPPAYSPDTGLLYVPTAETYAMYYLTETDPRGAMGLGGKDEVSVGTMGSYISAIDYKTGKTVWKHKFRTAGDGRGAPGPADDGRQAAVRRRRVGQLRRVRSGERQAAVAHARLAR